MGSALLVTALPAERDQCFLSRPDDFPVHTTRTPWTRPPSVLQPMHGKTVVSTTGNRTDGMLFVQTPDDDCLYPVQLTGVNSDASVLIFTNVQADDGINKDNIVPLPGITAPRFLAQTKTVVKRNLYSWWWLPSSLYSAVSTAAASATEPTSPESWWQGSPVMFGDGQYDDDDNDDKPNVSHDSPRNPSDSNDPYAADAWVNCAEKGSHALAARMA